MYSHKQPIRNFVVVQSTTSKKLTILSTFEKPNSFVQDRLNNKVNGWTFRFFTKGGKKVIIKSVVTALPNHVMSVYRLPKATVKKLTSAVTQFLWSQGESTKDMYWKSWDKLCVPKNNGGLGFKDIIDFHGDA